MPALLLHNGICMPQHVSRRAKQFLEIVAMEPVFVRTMCTPDAATSPSNAARIAKLAETLDSGVVVRLELCGYRERLMRCRTVDFQS